MCINFIIICNVIACLLFLWQFFYITHVKKTLSSNFFPFTFYDLLHALALLHFVVIMHCSYVIQNAFTQHTHLYLYMFCIIFTIIIHGVVINKIYCKGFVIMIPLNMYLIDSVSVVCIRCIITIAVIHWNVSVSLQTKHLLHQISVQDGFMHDSQHYCGTRKSQHNTHAIKSSY